MYESGDHSKLSMSFKKEDPVKCNFCEKLKEK